MNPTDHAAKRDALQEAIALEVALRDKSRSDAERHERMIVRLEAAITALDATPVYPSVTFTGFTGAEHTIEYVAPYFVADGQVRFLTAVSAAFALAEGLAADAIVTRLLALKGGAASGGPSWWVNVERGFKWGYAYSTEAIAREQHNVRNAERIAVPVYEAPHTPVAYQKIGACVTAGDGYMTWTYGTRQVANAREWAAQHGGTAHVLYAGEALT